MQDMCRISPILFLQLTIRKFFYFPEILGSGYSRLNGEFDIPEKVDLIFMEAIYTEYRHKDGMEQYELFRNDLKKALAAGKTVWISSLSFNRTQKVLYELKLMQDDGSLSKKIPVYSISSSVNAMTTLY
jgi:metallo-beta-lactamase family protein